jgi:ornithine cyclodeaminase
MPLLVLGENEVRKLLPISRCIELMDRTMRAVSDGSAGIPERIIAPVGQSGGQNHLFTMPGALQEPNVYGAKLVSSHPSNPLKGLPAFQGFVALFDAESGSPTALVDGAAITALRTAAASALATRELARRGARTHGILGTGVQAREHALAMAQVRDIREVCIWGRNRERAESMAGQLDLPGRITVRVTGMVGEAAACDIVSACTGAITPVLRGGDVRPGAHINLVGSHSPNTREADSDLLSRASIYCDRRASLMAEAGDFLVPLREGRISEEDVVGEIGQLLNGEIPGRRDDQQVTLYKSLGVIAQDLAAAEAARQSALKKGVGSRED